MKTITNKKQHKNRCHSSHNAHTLLQTEVSCNFIFCKYFKSINVDLKCDCVHGSLLASLAIIGKVIEHFYRAARRINNNQKAKSIKYTCCVWCEKWVNMSVGGPNAELEWVTNNHCLLESLELNDVCEWVIFVVYAVVIKKQKNTRNTILGRYRTHDHYKSAVCHPSYRIVISVTRPVLLPPPPHQDFAFRYIGSDCCACAQIEAIHLGNMKCVYGNVKMCT